MSFDLKKATHNTDTNMDSLVSSWLKLLTSDDFIQSAIENNDREAERCSTSDEDSTELFSGFVYHLKQMPDDFFRRVPHLLEFNLPPFPAKREHTISTDIIDLQSYQFCSKLQTQNLTSRRDRHRFLVRQFANHLLPLHCLPEYCSSLLGYDSHHQMSELPELIIEAYEESLQHIRAAIKGHHLYLSVTVSQEDKKPKRGDTRAVARRIDVIVGLLGSQKRYLVKRVPFLEDDQSEAADQFMLNLLIDSLNLLWPDQSWGSESKNIALLVTDYSSTMKQLIEDLRRLYPLTFAHTVHLYQFDQLLAALGTALNDWFKKEAHRTHQFISELISCIAHSEPPFVRYFLRRCYRFVMKANCDMSYQEFVVHLREHFTKVQRAFCYFRTDHPSDDLWHTVAHLSDVAFFEEFNAAAIISHLSLLISHYISQQDASLSSRTSLALDIISILQAMHQKADFCRWAASSEPITELLNGIYESAFQQPEHLAYRAVLLGGCISLQTAFPLTYALLQQFPTSEPMEAVLSVIYASREAERREKIERKRTHLQENYRYRSYYYGDKMQMTEPWPPMSNMPNFILVPHSFPFRLPFCPPPYGLTPPAQWPGQPCPVSFYRC